MRASAVELSAAVPDASGLLRRCGRWVLGAAQVVAGAAVWVLALSFGVVVPGVGFAVLGALLVLEGRLARGESVWPALEAAPRWGGVLAIAWLAVLPARLLWAATLDARVIAPTGAAPRVLFVLTLGAAALALAHLALAVARGAQPSALLWPPSNLRWLRASLGEALATRRLRVAAGGAVSAAAPAVAGAREPAGAVANSGSAPGLTGASPGARAEARRSTPGLAAHLVRPLGALLQATRAGMVACLAALGWLLLPALLWLGARGTHADAPRPGLVLLGGAALLPVLALLPWLQAGFAASGDWRDLFRWRAVRQRFRRAPLAWAFALLLTYALTTPLYLLKVVLLPRDAGWVVALLFVVTAVPVRCALGLAWRRAGRRHAPAHLAWVWFARVLILAVLLGTTVALYLAPIVDVHGRWALLAHHAFLLPSPF